jgi:Flp pilus assembly protein CpaB
MERKWILILSLALGLISLVLVNIYQQEMTSRQQGERLKAELRDEFGQKVAVIVARVDIPKNTKIDETMLAYESVPEKFVEPGALRRGGEVVGKMSLIEIPAGTQITRAIVSAVF